MAKRDFLSAADLSAEELDNLLELAARMKAAQGGARLLNGKMIGLLFFDRSLRTRVSFEVATQQLGGHCINIFADEMYDLEPEEQVVMDGTAEEHVKDAARTLSRYVDALGIRQLSRTGSWEQDRSELLLRGYARHATIPVINLESTMEHPCQAIADVLTMKEHLLRLQGRRLTVAWSNNPSPKNMGPCHSVVRLAATLGMEITIAHPLGFELDEATIAASGQRATAAGGSVRVVNALEEGLRGAEVVYTRSWGSTKYWDDPDRARVVGRGLQGWILDEDAMSRTAGALFMHPLPVRRGVGASDAVLDGPRSVIYEQAENRVHAQKALLAHLLG